MITNEDLAGSALRSIAACSTVLPFRVRGDPIFTLIPDLYQP